MKGEAVRVLLGLVGWRYQTGLRMVKLNELKPQESQNLEQQEWSLPHLPLPALEDITMAPR